MTEPLLAGPGLDMDVARAIGITTFLAKMTSGDMQCTHLESGEGTFDSFRPSTNLNDSFWAAELFGLFACKQHDMALVQSGSRNHWFLSAGDKDFCGVSEGETPALAISRAILNLKNKG